MNVIHTEGREIGQIYVPFVNWALAAGTLAAVIGFGSSDALAGAFGIAVSLLMVITTLMATFVALHWKYNPLIVYAVNGSLLALDLLFFASTSTKLFDGGWFPLLIAFVIAFLMLTWRKGEESWTRRGSRSASASRTFVERLRATRRIRIPGHRDRARPPGQGRAAGAVAQRQVQPCAARTRAARRGRDDRNSARRRRGPRRRHAASPRASPAPSCASASWRSRTCPRPRRRHRAREDRRFDLGEVIYYTGHETIIPSAGAPACRGGARRSSRSCTTTPSDRAPISRFRARRSWKSASSSRSEPGTTGGWISRMRMGLRQTGRPIC